MFVVILISLISLLFPLIYYASRNKATLEIMPTLAWFTFMVFPFYYSMEFLDSTGTNLQFLGITFIHTALLVSDWYSVRIKSKSLPSIKQDTEIGSHRKIQSLLILIVLVIPVAHALISGTSPLFDLVFKDSSNEGVSMDRALYTKFGVTYFS